MEVETVSEVFVLYKRDHDFTVGWNNPTKIGEYGHINDAYHAAEDDSMRWFSWYGGGGVWYTDNHEYKIEYHTVS